MKYLNEEGSEFVREVNCMGCDNIFLSTKRSAICYCPDCKTKTKFTAFKNGKLTKRNLGKVK